MPFLHPQPPALQSKWRGGGGGRGPRLPCGAGAPGAGAAPPLHHPLALPHGCHGAPQQRLHPLCSSHR